MNDEIQDFVYVAAGTTVYIILGYVLHINLWISIPCGIAVLMLLFFFAPLKPFFNKGTPRVMKKEEYKPEMHDWTFSNPSPEMDDWTISNSPPNIPEPVPVEEVSHKRLWYFIGAICVIALIAYSIVSGEFIKNAVACLSGLFGLIVIPIIFTWVKNLPRSYFIGLVVLIMGVILAFWQPEFFSLYWFPILMFLVYLGGVFMTWKRHHSYPPPNQQFSQGGQYAMSYSVDYLTPWERSKQFGKIFAIVVPILVAINIFGRSAGWGQGFWFGAFGIGILITELIFLFQL